MRNTRGTTQNGEMSGVMNKARAQDGRDGSSDKRAVPVPDVVSVRRLLFGVTWMCALALGTGRRLAWRRTTQP